MITASDWRPISKNTLQGFCTLTLSPSGLVLKECSLHARPDGKRWIGLPSKPQIDSEGRHRKDPATGKLPWTSVVEIAAKIERERFQRAALFAIDKLRGESSSRNNTVGGSYRTTPVNKMRAFDKLPPETRAALANAVEDWVPQTLLTNYRRGCNDEVLAMMVRRYDAARARPEREATRPRYWSLQSSRSENAQAEAREAAMTDLLAWQNRAREVQGRHTGRDRHTTVTVTYFDGYAGSRKNERQVSIEELAEQIRIATALEKSALPWLKLARFGNEQTSKGSLRHDRNVISVTGCEADYDGEEVGLDDVIEALEKAGVLAIVYTSPSYRPDAPRWRALCPFSRDLAPPLRAKMVDRLNGLLRGVVRSRELVTVAGVLFRKRQPQSTSPRRDRRRHSARRARRARSNRHWLPAAEGDDQWTRRSWRTRWPTRRAGAPRRDQAGHRLSRPDRAACGPVGASQGR